jgi:hypothetical protein
MKYVVTVVKFFHYIIIYITPMQEERHRDGKEYFFEIKDIHCASALLSIDKGYTIAYIDKGDPKNCVFAFNMKDDIRETSQKYFLNQLEVRARTFADNLRSLKNQIYR